MRSDTKRLTLTSLTSFVLVMGSFAGWSPYAIAQDTAPAAVKTTEPQAETPKEKPAGPQRGTIIREPVNPYRFQPPADAIAVDAATVDLKKVFEDLGPDAIEWFQHVQTLSNPWFDGRAPGTEGHDRAAEYFSWWMKKIGLAPAFGGPSEGSEPTYFQPFELTGKERQVKASTVAVLGNKLASGKDYAPMGVSGSGAVTGSLAFAGYAIAAGEDGYTSFDSDDDIRGRVVMFFRYEPLDADGKSKWAGNRFSAFANLAGKLEELTKRGAVAIIMVNPPGAKEGKEGLEDLRTSRWGEQLKVPFVQMSAEAADALVKQADLKGRDLLTLRKLCDDAATTDFAMRESIKVTVESEVSDGKVPAKNVGGILAGKGALKDEWIVVGGHFDHVGYGYFGSDPSNRGKLHPGADDNASGSSGVLVLARQLKEAYDAAPADANMRSVLFLAFSAEESGLDGSKHWVKHPTIAADKVDVMLNMDMIGRLRSDTLSVGGYESAVDFDKFLDPIFAKSGLEIHADPSGRGPSDHASFYGAGIPVLFFFTGTHDVYHRPGDKGYTVNPGGAIKVINLVREIAMKAASDPVGLKFKSTEGGATPDRGYAAVRLGVMPAMGQSDETGVKVESVSAETSAADAGIKPGDTLLTWDGKELIGTGDMMAKLREHKPGDVVKIMLRRDGKEQEVTVTLKASKPRE